jgi:uncharacterized membrane protein YeaQ/YmgE (transglycosylase-associated protein family)
LLIPAAVSEEPVAAIGRVRADRGRPSALPTKTGHFQMGLSGESLIVIIVVGIIAGWLAGQVMQGTGFGLLGDLVIGIVGAFVGSWLLPQLHIHLGSGILTAIINATVGAILVLFLLGLLRGGRGWRRA